jgi:hypothetical protein
MRGRRMFYPPAEDTKTLEYIVGRPITVGDKDFWPAEDLPQEYVDQIPLIDSWVSAGYLYRVHPDLGYDRLPPHIYNDVVTRKEAEAKLAGDPGITAVIDAAQETGRKADVSVTANKQAKLQRTPRRTRKLTAEDKASAVEVTPEKEK